MPFMTERLLTSGEFLEDCLAFKRAPWTVRATQGMQQGFDTYLG